MTRDEDVTVGAALAAKSEVLARLRTASDLFSALRSIGIGLDTQGDPCVRVTVAPEALDAVRAIVPETIDGVAIELYEGGPIRTHRAGS